MWFRYRKYVPVARRHAEAAKLTHKLAKAGRKLSPVRLADYTIAASFWGKAWCQNLESYSDFSNRLPRGRTYVRNGSVIDLQIEPGVIRAMVSGSSIYDIIIKIVPLPAATWQHVKQSAAGGIRSAIELLAGRLSNEVMAIVTDRDKGLFPAPAQIDMQCSCPDFAGMCKHLAAVMYGVGARLDAQPELLFTLRQVNHLELIPSAESFAAMTEGGKRRKTIAGDQLSNVFGVELEPAPAPVVAEPAEVVGPQNAASPKAHILKKKKASPARTAKPAGRSKMANPVKPAGSVASAGLSDSASMQAAPRGASKAAKSAGTRKHAKSVAGIKGVTLRQAGKLAQARAADDGGAVASTPAKVAQKPRTTKRVPRGHNKKAH
ncbi:MAG: hypothetical protein HKL96_09205 [Phycisphaerales bacterium]|nr:hypothetical protein [Phycisphaerales bacterium]